MYNSHEYLVRCGDKTFSGQIMNVVRVFFCHVHYPFHCCVRRSEG